MSRYFDLMQQAGVGEAALAGNRTNRVPADVRPSEDELDNYRSESGSPSDEILDLVQRIFLVPGEDAPRIVVFAGIDEHRDVSQICVSVAETLARVSKRAVCLVEGNFRAPNLHGIFGMMNRHGLADALAGDQPISNFCQPMAQENLWLLPSGPLDGGAPSLLTPDGLKSRFSELRDSFEFLIVNGASVARYAETAILGRVADGMTLVLGTGSTRREEAAAAIDNLRSLRIPILAAVLDKEPSRKSKKLFR